MVGYLLDHGHEPLEALSEPVPCARRARDDLPLPVADLHQIEHLCHLRGRQRVEEVLLVGIDQELREQRMREREREK